MKYTPLLFLILLVHSCSQKESSQGEDFISKVDQTQIQDDSEKLEFFDKEREPIATAFQILPTGSTRPKGWMLKLMEEDLETGIVGALDKLYPGIKSDDLYNTHRRGGLDDVPEMGDLVLTGAEWEQSIMWWNAETIGNWWDGFIRHAFLTNNEKAILQSHKIAENLLSSQDEDGYIGIYKPNLRYQHEGSNGELWAQTTAFRSLLGYYEFTKDERVLEAVEKGVVVTMQSYGEEGKNPFKLKNAFGGVTHGLMFTDVCETLHRITGKQEYQDYAVYLYKAFSSYSINRSFNDLRYPFLVNEEEPFTGHAVHTYEHFRTLINAYYQTGYAELGGAFTSAIKKLDRCILPGGAGHGNEWIAGLDANATETASEFCTMLELRNSFTSIVQKTGDMNFADQAEKLTYNGMMGFRNSNGTAITYGKHDNAFILDGKHHNNADPRYKYSPTHSDPAVCCVPNYARNYAYFLDNMWMKTTNGIAAIMYGPSELKTTINGVHLTIHQETNYPFSDQIRLKITCDQEVEFPILLRKPKWSETMEIESSGADIREKESFIEVSNTWKENELVITFENEVQTNKHNNEAYLQRGPLVYAYSIPHRRENIKAHDLKGFHDYYCFPTDDSHNRLVLRKTRFTFSTNPTQEFPWYNEATYLEGIFADSASGEFIPTRLIPMGSTVLRRVTFPVN